MLGSSNSSKEIIISHKVFGFNLYERKRLSHDSISLNFESVNCEDIGLYVIGKFPRMKYNNFAYSENLNWNFHAKKTIRLTILNLINKGVIEIVETVEAKSYLFNAIKNTKTDYSFNITDLQVDKDWFSVIIYDAINEVNIHKYPGLKNYVRIILDKVLYKHNTFNKPARSFLVTLLKKYAKTFPWIDISTEKKYLGIYKDYSIKVEEIYIPRINMQHESLLKIDNDLFYQNKNYKGFCNALNEEIKRDFTRREPDDSHTD